VRQVSKGRRTHLWTDSLKCGRWMEEYYLGCTMSSLSCELMHSIHVCLSLNFTTTNKLIFKLSFFFDEKVNAPSG